MGTQAQAILESVRATGEPARGSAEGPLTPRDLADLLSAFNETSLRLQQSHEALSGEVARLKGELAHANEQLERSRRLAALGEMAAGISHEVRNPLGSIRLYARMLEQDLADRPAEREIAIKVARAVQGLDAVVGDVLAFARELQPNVQPCGIADLFDRAVEESMTGLADRIDGDAGGVRMLRLDRQRDGDDVWVDPGLAHRALVNVIRNAVEAVQDRRHGDRGRGGDREQGVGAIVLDTLPVRVAGSGARSATGRSLIVRDTGGGLSADAMQRMFNPFFTTRAAGTGLGLAIVHRIVDAHGGRIGVRNVGAEVIERELVESGACIELVFPNAEPASGKRKGNRCSLDGATGG